MEMIQAGTDQLEEVYSIVRTTIEAVYPHYYPAGAVAFFLSHHQRSYIAQDIGNAAVYLFVEQGNIIATCTVRGNELCRFFVLPAYQRQGFGSAIMDRLEQQLFARYNKITLAASLPALALYQSRGYQETAYVRLPVADGDYLCYWTMELLKR